MSDVPQHPLLHRYYVPNPAVKGCGWFGFFSTPAQQTLDPGFAVQQKMLKSTDFPITAMQRVHVVAESGRGKAGRISHDAEQGRRLSDDVHGQESAAAKVDQPAELELLKGVSGFAVPGKLMALMGGSGAGAWETLFVC